MAWHLGVALHARASRSLALPALQPVPLADLLRGVALRAPLDDRPLVSVRAGEEPLDRLAQQGRLPGVGSRLTASGQAALSSPPADPDTQRNPAPSSWLWT